MRGRNVFVLRVAEIVNIELPVPVSHHRLVVVGPTVAVAGVRMFAVGTKYLDVMYTNNRIKASVVTIGIAQRGSCIMNLLGVEQPFQDGLVSHKDSAMFVQIRYDDLVADVLERDEVLREMCAEVLQAIAVIVYQPSMFYGLVDFPRHFCCRGTFYHLACKGL